MFFSYRFASKGVACCRAAKKRLRGVFRRLGGTAVQLHAARQRHVAKAWRCSGRIRLIKYIYVYISHRIHVWYIC
jgi:hypothetical protein